MALNAETFAKQLIRHGQLSVTLPNGQTITAGDGTGPDIAITLKGALTIAAIIRKPSLGIGEAYMDGRLTIERGTIHDLVDLGVRSMFARPKRQRKRAGPLQLWWAHRTRQANQRRAARRNVAHHYDLSLDLYRRFLDPDLQYSCAYFEHPGQSLEDAQVAKKRHIAAKLALKPGQRVLDIGCGWGGMAMTLAAEAGVHVDGVTLSTEQLETARTRADAAGLSHSTQFSLTDYRDVQGPYDRIVSVGMFEHVGQPNFQAFFDKIASLLTDDGVALIHSIGRAEGPSTTDPFTAKYIFPGGYIPGLSEVLPAVERAGLWVTDIEILRMHYAETLRCWRERFWASRAEIAALYDERFCRFWEYYLCGAEAGFRYGGHMNFQLQLTKRRDALPVTRDYMAEAERALAADERSVA